MASQDGIVYSTEHGRMCPTCGKPDQQCTCGNQEWIPVTDGIVRISRQTKGRKGKGVTVITGLPLTESQMKALAKQLKAKCGCGGTVKDSTIEIQGDHRDKLMQELKAAGYTVKRSGG